jgi:hypothetical protein
VSVVLVSERLSQPASQPVSQPAYKQRERDGQIYQDGQSLLFVVVVCFLRSLLLYW